MNFDLIAFGIFVLIITIFLIHKRKKLAIQKLLFPLFYFVLYRTNFGLKWMDHISKKYRSLVRLFGYMCIGFGFVGMIWVSISIIYSMGKFFLAPSVTETGMTLILPGTNIPGFGVLSFFYFIISILVLAIVHEFSHGVVMRAHDMEVKSSGFAFLGVLFPIIPAAFVEPDEKKMAKREPHVQYSALAAGPISNVLLSLVFLLLLMFVMAPIESNITDRIGFSFDVSENYPAFEAGLNNGVIIDSFNGEEVMDANLFLEKMRYDVGPDEVIQLGSNGVVYNVTTMVHPDDSSRGFIGVTNIKNEGKVKEGWDIFGKVFFWIKGLFKWLYLLNIAIGLVNLLPVYITDGAKMLLVALQDGIKNQKKALKIWAAINWLFVFLIVAGLFGTYLKQFGLF